jgi:hypothetical protein
MENINAMHLANESQERKNLRALPNKLGYNRVLEAGGFESATEHDCWKIEGHSELFHELEDFEKDMEAAVIDAWKHIRELNLMIAGIEAGTESTELVLDEAVTRLRDTFQYLQEAFWIAEVLDDRERSRLKMRDRKDFMDLIETRPRSAMSGLDKLAEEGRIEWMISCLLDRMAEIQGWPGMEWPRYGRAEWQDILVRLETAAHGTVEVGRLQDMNDEELAEALRTMEACSQTIRKTITMIHAIRTVRNG